MPMEEIRKGPDGSVWQFRVSLGRDPVTGRYPRAVEHFHGPTQTGKNPPKVVQDEYAAFVSRARAGLVTSKRGATLNDAWAKFLEVAELAPYTRASYTGYWDKHVKPALGRTPVADLTPMNLTQLYSSLRESGLAAVTVRKVHALVRNALKTACNELHWITVNPAGSARVPRGGAPRKPPSPAPEHVAKLIALAHEENPELEAFFELAVAMGSRRGETLALRRSALEDREDGGMVVHVTHAVYKVTGSPVGLKDTKDHQARDVHLSKDVATLVRAHVASQTMRAHAALVTMAEDPFLFARDVAGHVPWLPDYATKRFAALWARTGGPHAKLHDLRHHMATEMILAGVPVTVVKERLGHASIATTNIYAHGAADADVAAADVMAERRRLSS